MLPWQSFVMNVSRNRKVKKLACLPGYRLDLAQILCRGYFWILNPKSTKENLCDVILTSKWREGKIPIYRLQKMHMTSFWRHLLFIFWKTSIFLLLIRDYQHTKFGLIWVKESKVRRGGGGDGFRPPGWECIKSPRWDRVNQLIKYCQHSNIDPYTASVTKGIEVLTKLFNSRDLGYSSLNTARSALSLIIEPHNGISFGKRSWKESSD